MRNEKGEVTIDTTEIQRIIRDYYKQLYTNKKDNQEEMDKFLERYNLPRVSQEETENMNRPITSTETETVIKKNSQQQDRNKDADRENGLEDTGRGKGKLGQRDRVAWT